MISYELSYGLALASVHRARQLAVAARDRRSSSPATGGSACSRPAWYVFLQPVGFFIYMIAGVAETNRAPFDFPEAEQELVAGLPHRVQLDALRAVLPRRVRQHGHRLGGGDQPVPRRLARAVPAATVAGARLWFLLKVGCLLFFYIWMRWTLPRYRYDQLMDVRLEVAAAAGGRQPARDRGRRCSTLSCS